jgi:hypothetical protein
MFNEIQQYIKDKDYSINNDDSICLEIMADFKENLINAYWEIFEMIEYRMQDDNSCDLLNGITKDALDDNHETLTNLITHYTNDYIKTINADIEGIEEEARESADDRQQDIDCDNSERLRSI